MFFGFGWEVGLLDDSLVCYVFVDLSPPSVPFLGLACSFFGGWFWPESTSKICVETPNACETPTTRPPNFQKHPKYPRYQMHPKQLSAPTAPQAQRASKSQKSPETTIANGTQSTRNTRSIQGIRSTQEPNTPRAPKQHEHPQLSKLRCCPPCAQKPLIVELLLSSGLELSNADLLLRTCSNTLEF